MEDDMIDDIFLEDSSVLKNICHGHFGGNIYEKCTKKINLISKNGNNANITEKNNTTEENHGKYVANVSAETNRKGVKVITKTNRVIDEMSNDNPGDGTENLKVKDNNSLSEKGVTLFDLDIAENKKRNMSLKSPEENADDKNHSKVMKDIKELTVMKEAIVENLSTKIINGSLTKIVNKNFENNDKDNVQKYDLRTNVKNKTMAKNVNYLLQNNSNDQNVQRYNFSKKENDDNVQIPTTTEKETLSFENGTNLNDKKFDKNKNVKNPSMTENDTIVFENSTNHNVQKYDLPKRENNDLHKKGKAETITENVNIIFQNGGTNQDVEKYDMHKYFKNSTTDKNSHKYDLPKNDNNDMHKNIQKYDSPKNVQKRDIGIPKNVSSDKMPIIVHQNDDTKYQKFNSHEKYKNHDIAKNNHKDNAVKQIKHHNKHTHKINDDELYNYQNYEMNYKKIIDKNELDSKKHTGRFDDNVSHKILPQIQTRIDNEIVKKSLDEFKMVRRKTHYTLPPIDFKKDNSIPDTDRFQDLVDNNNYDNKAKRTNAKYNVDSEYPSEYNQNNAYETYDERNYQSYEEPEMPHYKELNKILARQKEIVRQLAQIQLIGRNKDGAFYDLLDEVKAKQENYKTWKNYTKFSFDKPTTATTTKKTTTAKPTTVLTVFDETEIRRALKNDPQIKRILKLANLKRKKYLDNVRNYLVENNYVHDKEYAKKLAGLKAAESTNKNNKV